MAPVPRIHDAQLQRVCELEDDEDHVDAGEDAKDRNVCHAKVATQVRISLVVRKVHEHVEDESDDHLIQHGHVV